MIHSGADAHRCCGAAGGVTVPDWRILRSRTILMH